MVEFGSEETEESKTGEDRRAEGDAEEDADGGGYGGVGDVDCAAAGAEDADEEEG